MKHIKKEKLYEMGSKEVKKALNNFELETELTTGVRKICGGFVVAKIFDFDDEYFDFELRWGIQNDCEDIVHTEQWKMNRRTLEITD